MNGASFFNNLLAFTDRLKTVGGVALAIVMLLVMVTIHEFGHYITGKILGFKIICSARNSLRRLLRL